MGSGNFNFHNPAKILSGKKALETIPFDLKSLGGKKPLVLCLKKDMDEHRDKILIKSFYESGITLGAVVDDDFSDGAGEKFMDIYDLFVQRDCDSVIFLGNGLSGNAARLIRLISDSGEKVLSMKGDVKISAEKNIPLIAVPTGVSDTDLYSGYAHYNDLKVNNSYLLPDVVCIDPRMTASKSSANIAAPSMGAFALAMDSLFVSENPFVISTAGIAVKFIMKYLPQVIKKPGDKTASSGLCNGVIAASMGIINSEQGLVGHLVHNYRNLYGAGSSVFAASIFKAAFDIYTSDNKRDMSKILLSLTGPDEAASVPQKDKMNRVKQLVEQLYSLTAESVNAEVKRIKLTSDDAGKLASTAADNAGKSYSKGDFEILLKKVSG